MSENNKDIEINQDVKKYMYIYLGNTHHPN